MLGDTHHMIRVRLRLIDAREQAGYSQGKAAELLGIHRPTLSMIEAGRQRLTLDLFLQLCVLYGFHPAELLHNGEGVEPRKGTKWIGVL